MCGSKSTALYSGFLLDIAEPQLFIYGLSIEINLTGMPYTNLSYF